MLEKENVKKIANFYVKQPVVKSEKERNVRLQNDTKFCYTDAFKWLYSM